MPLTPEEWTARAEEAETAIHNLILGNRVVEITSPDGTRVQYQEADMARLQSWLSYCQSEARRVGAVVTGPIYFTPL